MSYFSLFWHFSRNIVKVESNWFETSCEMQSHTRALNGTAVMPPPCPDVLLDAQKAQHSN